MSIHALMIGSVGIVVAALVLSIPDMPPAMSVAVIALAASAAAYALRGR